MIEDYSIMTSADLDGMRDEVENNESFMLAIQAPSLDNPITHPPRKSSLEPLRRPSNFSVSQPSIHFPYIVVNY